MLVGRRCPSVPILALGLMVLSGCATMRTNAPMVDLRPCTDGYAETEDGWRLGVRRYRPSRPDPGKLPVVLCHGLGLNGTFWTITDDHLPGQLAERGYEVFVPDLRGSGGSYRPGLRGTINQSLMRQTPLPEIGEGSWTMDDLVRYDVPAILDYVRRETGHEKVNWVGHSLGGMLMYAFLEVSPHRDRIANFVGMGCTAHVVPTEHAKRMLKANRGLRVLLSGLSTGRMARPMVVARLPGLDKIDRFYYTAENVDRRTISRFYGYTLEDLSKSALRQLDPYLERGRLVSADRAIDYAEHLDEITTPTVLIAGEGDIMADIPSKQLTFDALGSSDKSLLRFGRKHGHVDDYGHCDLVWSRHAPSEVFPAIGKWLDVRQPGVRPSPQQPVAYPAPVPLPTPQADPAPVAESG